MTDSGKNYEVEDLEELDDNNLDGNNEETDNVVDVKQKKYEPKFGMLFDNLEVDIVVPTHERNKDPVSFMFFDVILFNFFNF